MTTRKVTKMLNLFLAASLSLSMLVVATGSAGPAHSAVSPSLVERDPPRVDKELAKHALPREASSDWWAAAQENIRQSEYHVTWQDQTYLDDVEAAYQAPNRAHNLRTYFTPQGIRVIPRVFGEEGAAVWQWGLALTGYGAGEDVRPVEEATLSPTANHIEYRRGAITEWYVNSDGGLEQGFTLESAPGSAMTKPHSPLILELTLSGNLTPHLADDESAIEFTTPGGVRVLRYSDLYVHDAAGRELGAGLALGRSRDAQYTVRIAVDAAGAAYPITIDPLATSPSWTAESDQTEAAFGVRVSTAGDVNGDGYADVIVGAYLYDNGETNEGRAFVYHGSPTGLTAGAAWTAEGDQDNASFAYWVGTAGDVNGDGYADIVIGAPGYDNGQSEEGRAFVYHGGPTGLTTGSADWTAESNQAGAEFGHATSTAGDVNGDGYDDVIVGAFNYVNDHADEGRAFVYHGSDTGLSATADWTAESNQAGSDFGWAVDTAGDVNGDGYADVVVGAPRYSNGESVEGRAFVYYGSSTGLTTGSADWTAESDQAGAVFGYSAGPAGDVNGDGYADIVVGARDYDHGETDEGRVYVYHGAATGLAITANWTAESDQAGSSFGHAVGAAGDVNGDGYADIVVGAQAYDNGQTDEGRAFVYYGAATGLNVTADWTAESDQADAFFGCSAATAGDVNGDGYADVIIGAHSYNNGQTNEGRAFVYHGAVAGLGVVAAWTAEGDQAGAEFGFAVSTAGDVNGDGYADVVVGAYLYDNGQTDEGRAFVYHGSATGLSVTPAWTGESDQAGAEFGLAASTAGDVNGDGYADVITSARMYDNGQTDEGRVFLFYGSAAGLSATADWTAEGDQAGARFGRAVGTAGNVNGDGYADILVGSPQYDNSELDEGMAFVWHGSATGLGPNGTPANADWTAESNQAGALLGDTVNTAGDVNGDGYADVIVGAPQYDDGQLDEGLALVWYGSATGLGANGTPANADWSVTSNLPGDIRFACAVNTAGDVNGDGFSDIIIGASFYYASGESGEGRVFVYHGSASGLPCGAGCPVDASAAADWTAEPNQVAAHMGDAGSIGTAGDVNGDGYADVVVGVGAYDNGETDEGAVFVWYGSATGLGPDGTPANADWMVESNQAEAYSGYSASTAGDVNGDGYADVIVGARLYDNGQTNEGRALVYYGNSHGAGLLPRQLRTDGSVHIAPLGSSDTGTGIQLRLLARSPLGWEQVKLQWQVAALGTPFTTTTAISGTSAAWTDTLPTADAIVQNVTGLVPGTPYHWRVRLLYRPGNRLGQVTSRWITIPWNGWNEQDFRTPAPDLVIGKTVSPPAAGPGDPITYTLAFSNTGAATATGVFITDTIPISVTVSQVISSGVAITDTLASPPYVWRVQDLAVGGSGVITITGVLSSPLAVGTFTNTVTIATEAAEADTANNTSAAGLTVVNVAPVALDDSGSTDEDTTLNVSAPGVLANDSDANGDPLTVDGYDALSAQGAGVVVDADGGYSYDPGGVAAFQALAVGETLTDTFTYTATDGILTDTATVTITITGVNDAPTAVDDSGAGFTTDEDTGFTTGSVLTNDTDPDTSDTLSVAGLDTSGILGNVTDNGDGTFGYDPAGQFEYLAAGEQATDVFTYTVSDGHGGSDMAVVAVTIDGVDDEPTVSFSKSAYSVDEGDGTVTITVTLDIASALTATVDYATSDGTATAGADYTAINGTLTFTPGVTSQTFTVPILDDTVDESDETVTLTLSNASNATIGGVNPATLTIRDDDGQPGVRFSAAGYTVGEAGGNATITVTLSNASTLVVMVDYATSDGTATAGTDYIAASDTLTFTPGVTSQTFTVSITDDPEAEGDETVILTLLNASNATISGGNPVTLTIADNDDSDFYLYLPLIVKNH